MKMDLNEAKEILKTAGFKYLNNVVELSELNRRLQRLDAGWKFIKDECNGTANLYTIGKDGVGKFKFSVILYKMERAGKNPEILPCARFLGAYPEKDTKKNLPGICEMLFKED